MGFTGDATERELLIRMGSRGVTYTGRRAADVIVASAEAYVNVLNRLLAAKNVGG